MNKKDLVPVILLALLIPVWMFIDRTFIAPKYPAKTPVPAEQVVEATPVTTNAAASADVVRPEAAPVVAEVEEPATEEIIETLENGKVTLELSSWGGGIKSATLQDYPELNEKDSAPVEIGFDKAALAYEGLAGIGANEALAIRKAGDGRSVTFSKTLDSGLVYQRTVSFTNDYVLTISDRFTNPGANAATLDDARILTGRMENPADMKAMKGVSILGVDSFTPAGGVNYWGKKLHKLHDKNGPVSIDLVPEEMSGVEVDWVSTKNKFFVQILRPEEPVATMAILSSRDPSQKGVVPEDIASALVFKQQVIGAGESVANNYTYFIGPKNYSVLKDSGYSMEKVMEFETTGAFSFMNWLMEPARRFLLWTLNKFFAVIPNYGVAIILLTLLIRILFWPLTHKSTESMKRMQEIQPEIKALQAKYKKDPQRMQQETMKLYKEKKVNPMGGCIPMFVQIPVFIALFTVLRNAIELRYAGFLWIADLSQPENLFAGSIPFVGSLNILPLLMSVSMIWQQKLSSPGTAATPEQQQQQKMMMFMMPIMMLFFFYSMPSGLVLYWTTSNLLMIAQTGFRNLRKKTVKA
ncbi:Membrane protein insertase YidC [Pontiella desulfatans]|uniref:Membrane protein insertase YidC n=1 Tax=Pontiella desulfatans TaxID=2750659 RepID=A0A6C2U8M9_PONDE|nr:membrane protein insertase YidC [Pontiella desulfatans]VGO16183.1 Membrane protein insertase YidC [Pontiella desulfatans]